MPAKVLLAGMFDMDNYGDLLFPLMAAQRLGELGYGVQPVAPTSHCARFSDALAPIHISDMMTGEITAAGVVIGGGYIIHTSSMDFLDHYHDLEAGGWSGAGLWLGATLAAALRDVPVAWNAPGVPHPFSTRQRVAPRRTSRFVIMAVSVFWRRPKIRRYPWCPIRLPNCRGFGRNPFWNLLSVRFGSIGACRRTRG